MRLIGRVIAHIKRQRKASGDEGEGVRRVGRPSIHTPGTDRPDRVRHFAILPEVIQGIIAARTEERHSITLIAEKFGIHASTVHRVLNRHAISTPEDMVQKPRDQSGEKNHGAKLTEEIIRQIRASHAQEHLSHRVLARRFGVSQAAIYKVLSGKSWSHV